MIYAYTVYIDTADPRPDAKDRIQVEVARHLAVIFQSQFKGVSRGTRQ